MDREYNMLGDGGPTRPELEGRQVGSGDVAMTVTDKTVVAVDDDEQEEAARVAYARAVGSRLRAMRKQMRLSLQAVEAMSDQEFKASVLGAYERGERAISVPRLQRLAKLYDVPVDQLLPNDDAVAGGRWGGGSSEDGSLGGRRAAAPSGVPDKVAIDLTKLHTVSGPERDLLRRFLSMIQVHRQDFNGRMITIRAEDVRAIACLFGVTPDSMGARLDELGLLVAV
jgi:transcriptional regulator with XRE-family HTH domain